MKIEKKMYFEVNLLYYNPPRDDGELQHRIGELEQDSITVRCRSVDKVSRLAEKIWRVLKAANGFLKHRMSIDRAFSKRSE